MLRKRVHRCEAYAVITAGDIVIPVQTVGAVQLLAVVTAALTITAFLAKKHAEGIIGTVTFRRQVRHVARLHIPLMVRDVEEIQGCSLVILLDVTAGIVQTAVLPVLVLHIAAIVAARVHIPDSAVRSGRRAVHSCGQAEVVEGGQLRAVGGIAVEDATAVGE